MMNQNRAEFVIESLSVIKGSLVTLRSIYEKMPQLISKENKAISALDMLVIEEIVSEKNLLSESASSAMESIGHSFDKIFKNLDVKPEHGLGFAGRLRVIQDVFASISEQGLAAQIFEHLCKDCFQVHQEFRDSYDNLQPQFEVHRELTNKRLAIFRESYHFWAGVERELSGAYDKHGQKVESGSGSLIQTRA